MRFGSMLASSYVLGYISASRMLNQSDRPAAREYLAGLVTKLVRFAPEDLDDWWRGQADAALAAMGVEL